MRKKWERKKCLNCEKVLAVYFLSVKGLCVNCKGEEKQNNPILKNDKTWIYIKDSMDLYISENGNVKRIYKIGDKYFQKVMAQTINTGYYSLKVCGKTRAIHRLFATAFIRNPLNLPQVNHIDGNKLNNRIENLEWVTASQNIQHAYDNGLKRKLKGEKTSRAKMTNKTASMIIKFFIKNPNYSKIKISKRFGVSRQTIYNLLQNKTY